MPVTIQQIIKSLESSAKKDVIARAKAHQEKLRFHTQVSLCEADTSSAITDFLDFVSGLIPDDKFRIFCSLFRFPVKTVKETAKIKSSLGKVYDGQNPVYKYDFNDSRLKEDWLDYITNISENPNKWRTQAIDVMMESINSVVIVDLPKQQTSKRPEPYFYFLDIANVIDYQSPDGLEFDWIIFRQDKQHIVVIDEYSYRVFFYENDVKNLMQEGEWRIVMGKETYCPARFFWSESITMDDKDIKLSPLTTHLGDLDWLAYFMTAKQHLDTYAGYPIYSAYERDCDFEYEGDERTGYRKCDRGYLKDEHGQYMLYGGGLTPCPRCNNDKRLAGAGTYFEIPKPGPDNEGADMRNPVQITMVDTKGLEYNVAEVDRLKREIQNNIVGYSTEPNTEQAMNIKQIMATIEERTARLRDFKKNLERVMEWTEHTQAKIRYGDDFVGLYIDLGTDWYFYDSQYLLDLYQTAKKSYADDMILDAILDQYYAARYRNSPDQLKREIIIKHLDPCRHVTKEEGITLAANGYLDEDDLFIHINLSTFVLRFEREQAPLIEFGRDLPFEERINKINQIIRSYGKKSDIKAIAGVAPTGGFSGGAIAGAA